MQKSAVSYLLYPEDTLYVKHNMRKTYIAKQYILMQFWGGGGGERSEGRIPPKSLTKKKVLGYCCLAVLITMSEIMHTMNVIFSGILKQLRGKGRGINSNDPQTIQTM